MKLLMLGGTKFVGGAVVADAIRRGWTVSVFNRGRSGPDPAGVEVLRGDRTAPDGLAALSGGTWDVVVDTWSQAPVAVLNAARALHGRAGHYVYVSSRSVYAEPVALGVNESSPIVDARPDAEDGTYAEVKAGGENAAREVFGDRAVMARAGLILGPGEDVGRLPWWLRRVARGGDVLAPGPAGLPVQYIDARDLASWLLTNGEAGTSGPVNLVSKTGHATMGEILDAVVTTVGADARLRWTDPDRILAAGVEPWNDLPIWIPDGHEYRWLHEGDVSRAYATGLSPRPIGDTVAATWAWMVGSGAATDPDAPTRRPGVGLDPVREAAILAEA